MNVNHTTIIGPKNCPFTLNGRNIAEMRLAELRKKLARPLQIPGETKNEVLEKLIAKLRLMDAPKELSELVE